VLLEQLYLESLCVVNDFDGELTFVSQMGKGRLVLHLKIDVLINYKKVVRVIFSEIFF
jgi:hypothetical protein